MYVKKMSRSCDYFVKIRQIEGRGKVIKKETIIPVNGDAFTFTGENYRRFYYYKRLNDMQLIASLGYICQGELCGYGLQNRPTTGMWILCDRVAD
jgi:hypothetical protein